MSQEIIFCMGLPASGKSKFAKQYCLDNTDFERINKDDIRTAMGNPSFSNSVEKNVLSMERLEGSIILDSGKSLIIDDTNLAPKHWEYWQKIAIDRDIHIEKKFFDVSVEECIQRDSLREKPVGKKVIINMFNQYLKY